MQNCTFGLEFPEGIFLSDGRNLYFWVENDDIAYTVPANPKELMGKKHFQLETDHDVGEYHVTYEFEKEDLLAARLITAFNRSAGTLLSAEKVQEVNDKIAAGALQIQRKTNKSSICHAGQLMDGRYLILLDDYSTGNLERTLYAGPKDKLEIVAVTNGVQGGSSFFFTDVKTNERIEFNARLGARAKDINVSYGGAVGIGVEIEDRYDLTSWGIALPATQPHYDIFTHPKSKAAVMAPK